jgi:hypothetical protein
MAASESLKGKNQRYLVAWTASHALVAAWVVAGTPSSFESLPSVPIFNSLAMTLLVGLGVTLLNGLPSSEIKAALVFWRWPHPEPGHRAFSKLAQGDSRIDLSRLQLAVGGAFPTEARDQNGAWMRLYTAHESTPSVRTNHGEWLLFRDLAWLSFLTTMAGGMGAIVLTGASKTSLTYALASACLFLLCTLVARNHGNRFVRTVMACAASGVAADAVDRREGNRK